jgi:vacuolar-type H+-ATPase subunit E/Vma4
VLVDPRDANLARAQLADRDLAGTIKAELNTAGGVAVSTHGGRIFRRNTLEDRFEKLAGLAQADVARILFS